MIFPVVLGHGKRIFNGSQHPGALKLVDHSVSDQGVLFLTYEPAGEVPTGSFVTGEPSPDEIERRHKIEAGTLVSLILFGHPFSSYTWKALIPLYANGTGFSSARCWR